MLARRLLPHLRQSAQSLLPAQLRLRRHMSTANTADTLAAVPPRKITFREGDRGTVSGLVATVFGGTGFVGRYVVNALASFGAQVIVPYRGDGEAARHLKPMGDYGQIVLVPFDIADEDNVRRSLSRSNVAINLIGADYETHNYSFHDAHVKTAYRLAKTASEAGISRFVHLSTVSDESVSSNLSACPSKWVATKIEGEEVVRSLIPSATVLRCAPIYGIEDHFASIFAFMASTYPAIPLLDKGGAVTQPIYVNDVANCVLSAVIDEEISTGQVFELGGPRVFTLMHFLEFLHDITSKPGDLQILSSRAFEVASKIMEWAPPKMRMYITPDKLRRQTMNFIVSNKPGTKTMTDLFVDPSPLDTTLADLVVPFRRWREVEEEQPFDEATRLII